jgi:putative effector of murein hydrolase LrgA (UPF0299 family)
MTTVAAIAVVMAIIQFLKKAFPQLIQGPIAVIFVILFSVGVTAYKFISEGVPFTLAAITFLFSVIVGAMGAYGLIKVAGGSETTY